MRLSLRRRMGLAAGLGVFMALGLAPVGLPWATLAALAGAFVLFRQASDPRAAAWTGWALGTGYFAASLFWIVEPFLVDIARHGWMAPFALLLCAAGFALFWGAAFALAAWLCPGGARGASGDGRQGLDGGRLGLGEIRLVFAWAAALTAMELARSYILTGFPWALVGQVWVGWAPMQATAWVGTVGLTFLTLLLPALAMTVWPRWREMALSLAPFVVLYGATLWQAAQPLPLPGPQAPVVRLIQPNAAQHLKWDPDFAMEFFHRQLEFTAAGAEGRPDLVIWPETAIPVILNRAELWLEQVSTAAGAVPVVLGIQRLEGYDAFNSLIVLDGGGDVLELYDKHHLVPFGEYLPLSNWIGAVGLTLFGSDAGFGYSPGPGARVLDLGRLGLALPLICYEAIFPQDVHAAPGRADWLMQITNDAWFGKIAGPYQHLAQARLRAVEQGLPMVRVANTGVSAVIDARGAVLRSLPLGEAGWLDATLPAPLPPTLYARTGDWPVAVFLATILAILGLGRRRKPIDAAATAR